MYAWHSVDPSFNLFFLNQGIASNMFIYAAAGFAGCKDCANVNFGIKRGICIWKSSASLRPTLVPKKKGSTRYHVLPSLWTSRFRVVGLLMARRSFLWEGPPVLRQSLNDQVCLLEPSQIIPKLFVGGLSGLTK